jgi:uncharacterized metal-binding protein
MEANMQCPLCKHNKCRQLQSCGAELFNRDSIKNQYQQPSIQATVQAAATLVDNGRGGTLSRMQELVEFIVLQKITKVGLAYCYSMEKEAKLVLDILKHSQIQCQAVCCTTGALAQDDVNTNSQIHGVSCNPLGQAEQIEKAGSELAILMGLCMGHDILLQQKLTIPVTTLVVKDRTTNHNPLKGIQIYHHSLQKKQS